MARQLGLAQEELRGIEEHLHFLQQRVDGEDDYDRAEQVQSIHSTAVY
jgi:hypothetical protein